MQMCTVLALCCSRRTCPNVARRSDAVRKPRNTHDCCGHVTQSEQWLLQDPTSLVHVTHCPLPYHLLCACLWEPCPLAHNMDRRGIVSQWRIFSLGICSAFSIDREDPLPFLCLKDGPSRRACSHYLSFLRLDIPNTTCRASLSSVFKARTLSGAFQLTSSDGDNLVLPTMAQWQLICGAFLTWRLKSSNFLVGTLLGVKFQSQCWEWKFCRLWVCDRTKQLRMATLWLRNWLLLWCWEALLWQNLTAFRRNSTERKGISSMSSTSCRLPWEWHFSAEPVTPIICNSQHQ